MIRAHKNRTITYILNVFFVYLLNGALYELGLLKFTQHDYIPFLRANMILCLDIIIFILTAIWIGKDHQLSALYSFCKHNSHIITGCFFALEIITYAKVIFTPELFLAYIVVYYFYWMLLQSIFDKGFNYTFDDIKAMASYFSERPVVGRENLTKVQIEALDRIISVVDHRKREDSINIALIGEWGAGKTCITNTFIHEIQQRKWSKKLSEYFVLVINAQVINNTQSIVNYTKSYISELFRRYGISIFKEGSGVAFLSIMSDMLKDARPVSAIHSLLSLNSGSFVDVEQERSLFEKNIQKLLKRSKRKNIIFIIDNIDRIESHEQILQMLSEFSSIKGLISIVCMDPSYTLHSDENSMEQEKENGYGYKALDKYIHARIKINRMEEVEYEKSIAKQIIDTIPISSINENEYISFGGDYDYSIFTTNNIEIFKREEDSVDMGNAHNLLTKLFFIDFEKSGNSFGDYFESIVESHFRNTDQLKWCLEESIPNRNNLDLNGIGMRSIMAAFQWTSVYDTVHIEWTGKLLSNVQVLVPSFDTMIKGLKNLANENDDVKCQISTYTDVFIYEFNKETSLQLSKDDWKGFSGINMYDAYIFNAMEIDELNRYIRKREYVKATEQIIGKLNEVVNLYLALTVLTDFIRYMRNCMRNFRCFKMQLRECEIFGINYLDYLMREWEMSDASKAVTEAVLKSYLEQVDLKEIIYPTIGNVVNDLLLEKYILNYGNNFKKGELGRCTAHLKLEKNKEYILIESDNNGKKECFTLRLDGKRVGVNQG